MKKSKADRNFGNFAFPEQTAKDLDYLVEHMDAASLASALSNALRIFKSMMDLPEGKFPLISRLLIEEAALERPAGPYIVRQHYVPNRIGSFEDLESIRVFLHAESVTEAISRVVRFVKSLIPENSYTRAISVPSGENSEVVFLV